jgi:peroxiredoxin
MRTILTVLLCAGTLFAADVNRRAPGFSLMDSKGQLHDLADYRGKLVLLTFTQTTCPHCADFAEALQKTQEKYGDKIVVLAVVNPPDDTSKVVSYISGHKLTYTVLFDMGQMAYSYVLTANLTYPRLFMIDGGGTIRRDYQYGVMTRDIFEGDKLAGEIDTLLGVPAQKK